MRITIAVAAVAGLVVGAVAGPIGPASATFDRPTADIWNYPFNPSFATGERPGGSTFAAFGDPLFDERDAQMLTFWNTASQIVPGLGPQNYDIKSATLTFTFDSTNAVAYDPTQDDLTTYGPGASSPDADAGRPMELFGTGFRNGASAFAYPGLPFGFGPPLAGTRNAFGADVSSGTLRDVSNNVADAFNPTPFAIGTIDTLNPGDFISPGTIVTFEVNVADPAIEAYIAQSLNLGIVSFSLTSLHSANPDGSGAFPSFILDVPSEGTANAPTLVIEANIIPGPGAVGVLGLAGLAAMRRRR